MKIKQLDLTFTALLVPLDALALLGAAISAYALRFSRFVAEVLPILQDVPLRQYLSTAGGFTLVWIGIFALAGLYSIHSRKAWQEFGRIIIGCGAGTMLVIASVFFRRELTTSRFIVLAVFAFSILYVWLSRLFLRVIRHMLLQAHIGHRFFIIIGASTAAKNIGRIYEQRPILGVTVIRRFDGWNDATRRSVIDLKQKKGLDGILLADPELEKTKALDLIAFAEEQNLTFTYLADLFAASFTNISVSTETGLPIIEVKRTPLEGWGRIAKRAFDVIFASLTLLIGSPLLLIAALAVLLEDGFPIIFHNLRVGERGEPFATFKFRSMWKHVSIGPQFTGNEKERLELERKLIQKHSIKQGPVYKIANDPRVTSVGNILRRWSIDEFPQFWNVLIGNMSIVGPRPHQPREVEQYLPHQRRVLAIKPGITGLAQISGRSDLSFEDEVRLDTWYIENWSLSLDLYIVLKTPFSILKRQGAY